MHKMINFRMLEFVQNIVKSPVHNLIFYKATLLTEFLSIEIASYQHLMEREEDAIKFYCDSEGQIPYRYGQETCKIKHFIRTKETSYTVLIFRP